MASVPDPTHPYYVVADNCSVYVLMAGNETIARAVHVFDNEGGCTKTPHLHGIAEFAVHDGNIYMPASDKSIRKYNKLGEPVGQITVIYDGGEYLSGIAIDEDGYIYQGCFSIDNGSAINNRILKICPDGTVEKVYPGSENGLLRAPGNFATNTKGIYVCDAGSSILHIDESDNTTIIGNAGGSDGKFNYIRDLALDNDGNLYVADSGNNRIQKLGPDGAFIAKWYGCGGDRFSSPASVDVDDRGRVYVADSENQRVVWFDSERYVFGDNVSENLNGKGVIWGEIYAGMNKSAYAKAMEGSGSSAPASGFNALVAVLTVAGTAILLRKHQ